jgi:hypothetical protein
MAYLKSGDKSKSLRFIDSVYKSGILDESLYSNFKWKIGELSSNLEKFNICKTIQDTKIVFHSFATDDLLEDYKEFTTIFVTLLSGYSRKTDAP